MLAYTCIKSSEYARILNVPDNVHSTAFKICLSTLQLLRLLLREICIFSNVLQQIIDKAKSSEQDFCKLDYGKK